MYPSADTSCLCFSLADMSARSFYEPIYVSEFVGKYFNREPNRVLSDQDRVKVFGGY